MTSECKVDFHGLDAIAEYLDPIAPFLSDSSVSEIQIVRGQVFVERQGITRYVPVIISDGQLYSALKLIAVECSQEIDENTWRLDCRFAGGRLAAVFEPWSEGISVTIRKFGGHASPVVPQALMQAVIERENILISGASGAGKTTYLNALAESIPVAERIILIENPREIQLWQPNVVRWEARGAAPGFPGVTQRQLLEEALRHHPQRLILGEVRGAEAFELLCLLNTGHAGSLSTIHANSAVNSLERLTTCVLMAGESWPWAAIRQAIATNVHLLVHLRQEAEGERRLAEVCEVEGYSGESDRFQVRPWPLQ